MPSDFNLSTKMNEPSPRAANAVVQIWSESRRPDDELLAEFDVTHRSVTTGRFLHEAAIVHSESGTAEQVTTPGAAATLGPADWRVPSEVLVWSEPRRTEQEIRSEFADTRLIEQQPYVKFAAGHERVAVARSVFELTVETSDSVLELNEKAESTATSTGELEDIVEAIGVTEAEVTKDSGLTAVDEPAPPEGLEPEAAESSAVAESVAPLPTIDLSYRVWRTRLPVKELPEPIIETAEEPFQPIPIVEATTEVESEANQPATELDTTVATSDPGPILVSTQDSHRESDTHETQTETISTEVKHKRQIDRKRTAAKATARKRGASARSAPKKSAVLASDATARESAKSSPRTDKQAEPAPQPTAKLPSKTAPVTVRQAKPKRLVKRSRPTNRGTGKQQARKQATEDRSQSTVKPVTKRSVRSTGKPTPARTAKSSPVSREAEQITKPAAKSKPVAAEPIPLYPDENGQPTKIRKRRSARRARSLKRKRTIVQPNVEHAQRNSPKGKPAPVSKSPTKPAPQPVEKPVKSSPPEPDMALAADAAGIADLYGLHITSASDTDRGKLLFFDSVFKSQEGDWEASDEQLQAALDSLGDSPQARIWRQAIEQSMKIHRKLDKPAA